MKQLKKNVKYVATEASRFLSNRNVQIAFMLFMFALVIFQTAGPAFAAEESGSGATIETIANGIRGGLRQVYQMLGLIVIPVAVVALAYCGFNVIWGGDKGMDKARSTFVHLVIGLVLVFLAPLIISAMAKWFSSSGEYGVFDNVSAPQ